MLARAAVRQGRAQPHDVADDERPGAVHMRGPFPAASSASVPVHVSSSSREAAKTSAAGVAGAQPRASSARAISCCVATAISITSVIAPGRIASSTGS